MIISHKYKFIFFAIPKTGTHSMRFALRPFLDEADEEHVNLFHKSKLNIPEVQQRSDGHFTVQEIRPYIKDEIWNSYFKFAFVRNPFDRFVSACFFTNPLLKSYPEKATAIMKLMAQKELKSRSRNFRPQLDYLTDTQGNIAVDFVGKVENYQNDYEHVCRKMGIISIVLDKKNTTPHQHYTRYYDPELQKLVCQLFTNDIADFHYLP